MPITSFTELDLRPEILRAVAEAGYTTPTPIQAQAIPEVLAGNDIMGGAQTGTGKTAGFGLPILQRLMPHANTSPSPARHLVRALIIAPTRELAIQVEESIRGYAKYTGLRSTCVYGGVDIRQQLPIVRGGVEILVATPGRLLDHVEQKSVNLGHVETFVLDEADRMLDMGFIPDIKRIMALLPAKRQNLLFSATFSNDIKRLADELLNRPKLIEVARRNTAAETVVQSAYKLPQEAKRAFLAHLVRSRNVWQVLCFVRTKHGASRLARQLERDGLATSAIHGDKTQAARLEALAKFKDGKLQVLVATDVAARGLDIEDMPLVVNFELPHVPEDYIHRIGRTGRAGATGEAISLVAHEEEKYLAEIEKLLKKKVAIGGLDGFDIGAATSEARERPARGGTAHASRGAPHGSRSAPQATGRGTRSMQRAQHAPAPAPVRDRRVEREAAYAKNPDQPIVRRVNSEPSVPFANSAHDAATTGHGATPANTPTAHSHAHIHAARRSRPVPALLQKRIASEAAKG